MPSRHLIGAEVEPKCILIKYYLHEVSHISAKLCSVKLCECLPCLSLCSSQLFFHDILFKMTWRVGQIKAFEAQWRWEKHSFTQQRIMFHFERPPRSRNLVGSSPQIGEAMGNGEWSPSRILERGVGPDAVGRWSPKPGWMVVRLPQVTWFPVEFLIFLVTYDGAQLREFQVAAPILGIIHGLFGNEFHGKFL